MAPLEDTTKAKLANFLAQAAIAGSATTLVAGPLEALVAAAAGGVSAFAGGFIDKLAARDTRRAAELFENMVMADDEPVELVMLLAERLHGADEEVLIRLRAVMRADLEAAYPSALPAIARIGHEYIRGYVPSWVARGWLRVVSEASTGEVDVLGELASDLVAHVQEQDGNETRPANSNGRGGSAGTSVGSCRCVMFRIRLALAERLCFDVVAP